jgi:hypothetical protein
MSQPRRWSAVESVANVAIGYGVALVAQLTIFPLYGLHPEIGQNLAIGAWFTGVSLVRSYLIRRLFNHRATPRPTYRPGPR